MIVSENQQIIVDFLEAVKANDMDRIMEFFAPDCFYHNIPLEPVVGTAAIRQVLEGFNSLASEVEWTVHNIAETATGHVMTERTDGFLIGDKWIQLPVMGIFELRGGKIIAWRDYFDANQLLSQISPQ